MSAFLNTLFNINFKKALADSNKLTLEAPNIRITNFVFTNLAYQNKTGPKKTILLLLKLKTTMSYLCIMKTARNTTWRKFKIVLPNPPYFVVEIK
jgi:hypothetical protein